MNQVLSDFNVQTSDDSLSKHPGRTGRVIDTYSTMSRPAQPELKSEWELGGGARSGK